MTISPLHFTLKFTKTPCAIFLKSNSVLSWGIDVHRHPWRVVTLTLKYYSSAQITAAKGKLQSLTDMEGVFKDCTNADTAAMDYHMSPEEKAEEVANLKLNLGGRIPPCFLLNRAHDCDIIPEVLELEQAAYLVPYYNILAEIKKLIRIDDKDQFASFLIANHELVQKYPPDGLLHLLCNHSAVACATALLESPRLDVDINLMDGTSVYRSGMSPLHLAAHKLSSGMTKLLLEHGADAEIYSGAFETPLQTALAAFKNRKLKYIKGWTAEKSILTLFYFFCLPELKEPLDTVRLLASHSNNVEDLCIYFMNFGCVEDYAALLMVAWDKVMVSSAEGGLQTTPVGQHLSRVLSNASLQQEICERSFNLLSKERLVKNLTTALYVVETMWMTIGVLERYCHSRDELGFWRKLAAVSEKKNFESEKFHLPSASLGFASSVFGGNSRSFLKKKFESEKFRLPSASLGFARYKDEF